MTALNNTHAALRHICSRIVTLEENKAEIDAEIKEAKAKARSDGFDPALITKTVKMLRMDEAKRKKAVEQLELFDVYLGAVGLLWDREEDPPKESPEERGERLGRAGEPSDTYTDPDEMQLHLNGWNKGNKARLEEAQG